MNTLVMSLATVLVAGAAGAGCQIEPGAAGQPTYEADVRPIFMARCIRCHGSPPLGDDTSVLGLKTPPVPIVRFDIYSDPTCDAPGAPAGCVHGAIYETAQGPTQMNRFATYLNATEPTIRMPPAPAPPLTSYQRDTILNWANESPPLER